MTSLDYRLGKMVGWYQGLALGALAVAIGAIITRVLEMHGII